MIDELMATVLAAQYDRAQVARVASLARSVAQLGDAEVDLLLDHLIDLDTLGQPDRDEIEQPIEQLLQPIVDQLVQREQQQRSEVSVENPWSAERIDRIERLYLATPESSDLRNHLLRWLAVGASAEGLRCWLRLMVEHPPTVPPVIRDMGTKRRTKGSRSRIFVSIRPTRPSRQPCWRTLFGTMPTL